MEYFIWGSLWSEMNNMKMEERVLSLSGKEDVMSTVALFSGACAMEVAVSLLFFLRRAVSRL